MYVQKILPQEIIQRSSLRDDKTALANEKCEVLGEKVLGVGDLEKCVVGMAWRAR
jgi:hypothetical protein